VEHTASASFGVAILTAAGAFIGALISHLLAQRHGLDLAVYKQRAEVYKGLWEKTALLPKWPKNAGVTYAQARNLSEELRKWYFLLGGLYLSDSARAAYGNLQEALNDPSRAPNSNVLSDRDYDLLQSFCSKLRTELTHDLLSRKRMFLFSR